MHGVQLLFIVLMLLLIPVSLWIQRARKEKRDAVWRGIADERGGSFVPGEVGFFRSSPAELHVDVGGAAVKLDTYSQGSGKNRRDYTRASAELVLPGAPSFEIYREGLFQTLGKSLGMQDVELGVDGAFDDDFVVKTDERRLTAQFWSRTSCRRMREHFQYGRCRADGNLVTLVWRGMERDAARIGAALDLVGDIAATGLKELRALAELPNAKYVPPRGEWDHRSPPRIEVALERLVVNAVPTTFARTLGLTVRAPAEREIPPFAARVRVGGALLDMPPEGVINEEVAALLPRLGEARIRHGGRNVEVIFPEIPKPERLGAAVKVVAALCTADLRRGAFR